MRKILMVVAIISLGFTTYAQDTVKNKTVDTSSLTFKEVYTDIKDGIKGIAGALKQPAEHVYHVLITQSITNSITNLVIYIIFGGLLIFLYKRTMAGYRKLWNKDHNWYNDEIGEHTSIVIPLVALCVVGLIYCICILCTITETITGFVNPEYGALKSIFEFIHPKS